MAEKRVAYISSKDYVRLCDKHPTVKRRASLVDSLISAYDLKSSLTVVNPKPATKEDLLTFHSNEFVEILEKIQEKLLENFDGKIDESLEDIDYDNDEEFEEITNYGLGYDCVVFSEIYDYCKAVVGATISAANVLASDEADIAINLNGGWHHAHVDEAAGFCYINDVVIGILKLMSKFKRILYVDLDIHHGDGVEEAFMYSKKVMTLSLHNYQTGFFPGSGAENDIGEGLGKYFTANVPLKDGIDDDVYFHVFQNIFNKTVEMFNPEIVVCQCGADGLSGDPMGSFNLSSKGLVSCVREICLKNIPIMILGGGGYNLTNTARCWTEIVAAVLGKKLDEDLPEHDYLEMYGPGYSIEITPSNQKNENSDNYICTLIDKINQNIQCIQSKAIDQRQPLFDKNQNIINEENINSNASKVDSDSKYLDKSDVSCKDGHEILQDNTEKSSKIESEYYDSRKRILQHETQNPPKKLCIEK